MVLADLQKAAPFTEQEAWTKASATTDGLIMVSGKP